MGKNFVNISSFFTWYLQSFVSAINNLSILSVFWIPPEMKKTTYIVYFHHTWKCKILFIWLGNFFFRTPSWGFDKCPRPKFFDFRTDVRSYQKLTGKSLKSGFWEHRTFFEANFLATGTTFRRKFLSHILFVKWHR